MRINSALITLCLAAGTFALTVENGIATHWYPTGQPGPCQYVPEADPSYTVAISSGLDMKTLCGNWVVIKNTNNPDIEPLRATVTTTCTTCGENDLSLGMQWYYYLSNSSVSTEPTSIDIEWNFCDIGAGECSE